MSRKLIRPASLPSARRNAPYFTLIGRDHGVWSPIFGDRSRSVVKQELEDTLDSGGNEYRRKDLRIIETEPTSHAVGAAVAELNTLPAPVKPARKVAAPKISDRTAEALRKVSRGFLISVSSTVYKTRQTIAKQGLVESVRDPVTGIWVEDRLTDKGIAALARYDGPEAAPVAPVAEPAPAPVEAAPVLVEPEPLPGLDRRVFRRLADGSLEWSHYAEWLEHGERARFYGFASRELPASLTAEPAPEAPEPAPVAAPAPAARKPAFRFKCSYLGSVWFHIEDETGAYEAEYRHELGAYERSILNGGAAYAAELESIIGWLRASRPIPAETVAAFNAWRVAQCVQACKHFDACPERYGILAPDDELRSPRFVALGSVQWDSGWQFSPLPAPAGEASAVDSGAAAIPAVFTLISRPSLEFRLVRRWTHCGIETVLGVTLDGKRQTTARLADVIVKPAR